MTIEFNCPHCGALIAFDSKHSGKRAKCLSCGQGFLIPAESFRKPQKVEPEPEPKGDPIPGFYRAVFVDSWKLFVDPRNVTTLAFVVAVVSFRFFLAQGVCCLNHVANFVILGWLAGFYLTVISHTAIDNDQLPEIDIGTSITFLLYILGPLFVFFFTLLLVQFPFIIGLALARDSGVTFDNLWSGSGALHRLLQALLLGGLLLFPAAILTTAVGESFSLLRPDYLLAPLRRAFFPYLVPVALLTAACLLETHTTQYTFAEPAVTVKHLALNLLVQVVAIFAMRSIGLFYRHYACHFKW